MLTESLRQNELSDLISNTISIDEFGGKFDKEDLVVVFYVSDCDAAIDLMDFIYRGPYKAIDVEVSDYPNKEGNYSVFVEFDRDRTFLMKMEKLLRYVGRIGRIFNWYFVSTSIDEPIRYNKNNIEEYIRLDKDYTSDIEEYFENAKASFKYHPNTKELTVENYDQTTYSFIGFMTTENLNIFLKKHKLDINETINGIDGFGDNTPVLYSSHYIFVKNPNEDKFLVLKDL